MRTPTTLSVVAMLRYMLAVSAIVMVPLAAIDAMTPEQHLARVDPANVAWWGEEMAHAAPDVLQRYKEDPVLLYTKALNGRQGTCMLLNLVLNRA